MRQLQNDLEKIGSFYQNHRSNIPPDSAFTYGQINNGIAFAYLGDRSRHWRQEFGGLQVDQVKRLKEHELENSRLRKSGI